MKIHQFKNIEFAEVNLSDLYNDRIDAEYYKPEFIRNSKIIESQPTKEVKDLMYPPQYGLSIAMNEEKEGYKILKMDDIIDVLADDANAKYADISQKIFKSCQLNKFDVLFNRVNSDDFVGRTGIYLLDGEHTFASYLVRVTSDYSHLNCYLTIFLNCKYGYNCLQRVKRRAVNQANINAQELKALKIPTPSVSFQKKIENLVLESYEQKKQSETLYKEAEQLLLKALGLENWLPEKREFYIQGVPFETEQTITEISFLEYCQDSRFDAEFYKPKFSNIYRILQETALNKNWEFTDLGSLLVSNPKYGSSDKLVYTDKGVPFLRITDLSKYRFEKSKLKYISEDDAANQLLASVTIDDILISRSGSLGLTIPIEADLDGAIFGSYFIKIVPNIKRVTPQYLALYLNSFVGQVQTEQLSTGGIQTNLTISAIKKLKIVLPPITIQNNIVEVLRNSYSTQDNSRELLDVAKRAVEIYIEHDEKEAEKYLTEHE